MKPEKHPACAAFPPMTGTDLQELADDISKNGLLEPIVLMPDGLLLDGSARWDACERVSVEPRTVTYEENDPIGFVLSKNKLRRHLTKVQLALAVGALANLQNGSNRYQEKVGPSSGRGYSCPALAKQSGFGLSTVEHSKTLQKKAEPHIIAMVRDGAVALRPATAVARSMSRAVQATMTVEDVLREGRRLVYEVCAPSRKAARIRARDKGKKGKKGKTKTPRIDLPYSVVKFPNAEEIATAPPGSSIDDRAAIYEVYGRVQLHPKRVKEMLNARAVILQLTESICQCASNLQPEADAYVAALSDLLGYVMGPKDTIDFAKAARTTLARIEKALPIALARLTKLQEALEKRSNPAVLFG